MHPTKRGSYLNPESKQSFEQKIGLTKDNLAAYHDALALATQKAVLEGRFRRSASIDTTASPPSTVSKPGHVSFEAQAPARISDISAIDFAGSSGLDEYAQGEDDSVAAAIAEALENDD